MHSVAYLTVALTVAASAADPQPRAFGGLAPSTTTVQDSQQQASQASGASMSANPFGMSSSQFSNSQSSSSSYSSTQVVGAFSNIATQLSQMQSLIAGGSLSYQAAQQQMLQLANSFQTAFAQFPQCGSCLAGGGGPLLPVLNGLFNQFSRVMSTCQSLFGGQFGSLVSPLAGMSSQFSNFFRSVNQSGTSFSSFLPPNFGSVFGNVVPGALPTLNAFIQ